MSKGWKDIHKEQKTSPWWSRTARSLALRKYNTGITIKIAGFNMEKKQTQPIEKSKKYKIGKRYKKQLHIRSSFTVQQTASDDATHRDHQHALHLYYTSTHFILQRSRLHSLYLKGPTGDANFLSMSISLLTERFTDSPICSVNFWATIIMFLLLS